MFTANKIWLGVGEIFHRCSLASRALEKQTRDKFLAIASDSRISLKRLDYIGIG